MRGQRTIRFILPILSCVLCCAALADGGVPTSAESIKRVIVDPPSVDLIGKNARFTVLVHGETNDGRLIDLTRRAGFRSNSPKFVTVSAKGKLFSQADGQGVVEVIVAGRKLQVSVNVRDSNIARELHFENDVVPILSKFGCNASGCHGKAEGQNGFKLSVFGFDPPADHAALTQEGRGRRLFRAVPERSLLLLKSSGGSPHGGGVRIRRDSDDYRLLRDWIAAGAPVGKASAPKVVSIKVTPKERRMAMQARQQLRVVATYSDGRTADVSSLVKYQSNNDALAQVTQSGLITAGDTPGEAAVMAGYMGAVDVSRALIPRGSRVEKYPLLPEINFIDKLVDAKLRKLNIVPSGMAGDSDFLRRVYLDVIGTLPTAAEARAFLKDDRSDKRARLVDDLLKRPEYADYQALKWSDLLRVDRLALGHKSAYAYYGWIRQSFRHNKPYDQFIREIVAAEGLLRDAPGGNLYKVVKDPGMVASTISQVFLGVRIECAQCHHHPFDRWSQTDYFGMQAFFTQAGVKSTAQGEMLLAIKNPATKHPRTGAVVFAHPLAAANPETSPAGDRRKLLAKWMTDPQNRWVARNLVNRMWARFLGRGIVHPVDDVRSTNPPTNPELLDALAKHFVESGYDVHALIRTMTASRTYQLSSKPNATNERDEQNYSRALFRQMDAEVLLDAVCQTTGVAEKFHGVPSGYRAVQLWDSQVPHYFLKLFGRPVRATACECERSVEPSVGQVLHVLNSPKLHDKLTHEAGRVAALVRQHADSDRRLIEELYLTFYSRLPTETERNAMLEFLENHSHRKRRAAEDIAWTMMNTVEFLFNH